MPQRNTVPSWLPIAMGILAGLNLGLFIATEYKAVPNLIATFIIWGIGIVTIRHITAANNGTT